VRGDEEAAAQGHFVHVFVNREARKSAPIPERIRNALAKIAVGSI
jgi:acyl-CoA thioester hydrolase